MSGVTIQNGTGSGMGGGGIHNDASLTLSNVTLTDNATIAEAPGGAIDSNGGGIGSDERHGLGEPRPGRRRRHPRDGDVRHEAHQRDHHRQPGRQQLERQRRRRRDLDTSSSVARSQEHDPRRQQRTTHRRPSRRTATAPSASNDNNLIGNRSAARFAPMPGRPGRGQPPGSKCSTTTAARPIPTRCCSAAWRSTRCRPATAPAHRRSARLPASLPERWQLRHRRLRALRLPRRIGAQPAGGVPGGGGLPGHSAASSAGDDGADRRARDRAAAASQEEVQEGPQTREGQVRQEEEEAMSTRHQARGLPSGILSMTRAASTRSTG